MLVMSSALQQTGQFVCSDETVNKLQQLTANSDRSNFFYFPTDCPQREKNGWTGDAVLSCEQMLYNFDCSNSLAVWFKSVRLAQLSNGVIPGVVPTVDFGYSWGNGPAWDKVIVELPYQIYKFTGDVGILKDSADSIKRYLDYVVTKRNGDGLFAYGLPDWCEAGTLLEGDTATPLEVSDSLTIIDLCNKASFIFEKLSQSENSAFALEIARKTAESFRQKYLDNKLFVSCKTQTAQAMAISVGIFTFPLRSATFSN